MQRKRTVWCLSGHSFSGLGGGGGGGEGGEEGGKGRGGRWGGGEREMGGANKVVVFYSHLKGKHSAILFSCE